MKRLVLGLAPLLLLISTFALPATETRAATCTPTGFFRDGINLSAALINPPGTVSGEVDATGCNIGVYYNSGYGKVKGAEIHGANYFGVVVNGNTNNVVADILDSEIHHIGETPLNGAQHGVAVYYAAFDGGTATGKISGNAIWHYQKGGIVTNGPGTTANISNNTVTGEGPVGYIAQNGIQVGYGAKASVMRNTVTGNSYTGTWGASSGGIIVVGGPLYGTCGAGPCAYTVGTQIVGNIVVGNDVGIYLSNWSLTGAPDVETNVKVVNNVISNAAANNKSGNGPTGYQAGISDVGRGDKLINNVVFGAGYEPCAPDFCVAIDAADPYAPGAKVHANSVD